MSEKEVYIGTLVDQTDCWGSVRSPDQNFASSSKRVVNIIDEISHYDKECHCSDLSVWIHRGGIDFLACILVMLPKYMKNVCGEINNNKKKKKSNFISETQHSLFFVSPS